MALTSTKLVQSSQGAVFKLHYLCDACPLEWEERAACEGPSFCPCCDRETQPYLALDLREEVE
jgi:hypothetical protein